MFTLKYLFTICSKLIKQKYHLAILVLVMFEIWREMLLLKSIIPFSLPKIIHWSAFIFVRTLLSVNHQGGNELQCSMNMHSWNKSAGRLLYLVEPNVKVSVKATRPKPHVFPPPIMLIYFLKLEYFPPSTRTQKTKSASWHREKRKFGFSFLQTGNLPKSI